MMKSGTEQLENESKRFNGTRSAGVKGEEASKLPCMQYLQ